jgi:hypothetical protein
VEGSGVSIYLRPPTGTCPDFELRVVFPVVLTAVEVASVLAVAWSLAAGDLSISTTRKILHSALRRSGQNVQQAWLDLAEGCPAAERAERADWAACQVARLWPDLDNDALSRFVDRWAPEEVSAA